MSVKCGLCGTECRHNENDGAEIYWQCPRCDCEDTPTGHIQRRDRRINEAALAIFTAVTVDTRNESGGSVEWMPPETATRMAVDIIAAQDAAAQARGGGE